MDTTQADQFRAKVRDLAERFQRDAGFRDRVRADPTGTLAAEGLPGIEARPRRRDADPAGDVAGYRQVQEITDMSFDIVDAHTNDAKLC